MQVRAICVQIAYHSKLEVSSLSGDFKNAHRSPAMIQTGKANQKIQKDPYDSKVYTHTHTHTHTHGTTQRIPPTTGSQVPTRSSAAFVRLLRQGLQLGHGWLPWRLLKRSPEGLRWVATNQCFDGIAVPWSWSSVYHVLFVLKGMLD